ncbi:hypothetical protein MUN81_03200 [Hymenobacter sp. 5317J-9]|uniref:hypothetical protein n=1 Tax=Hymenobacter sp. 5317J-9 TaxID=2932250 RepID=UPI001FD6E649|nr:hypothetical protein [Hymenobacter sp. 5317J-9]UOQ98502.1 hypothetical protein MUN81_03200 [Hymenobacter sp. 5317J-9]
MPVSALIYVADASTVVLCLAGLIGVVRFRRLGLTMRYLVVLTLLAIVITAITTALQRQHRPNLFLFPIDTAIEFTLLALMYRRTLREYAFSRYIPALIGVFLLGTAVTYRPRLDTAEFSPVQHFIEGVVMLAFVFFFFRREVLRQVVTERLERDPMFWVSTGVLLYFSGNLLIFLTSNLVLRYSPAISRNVWAVHAMLYAFLNVFYCVALSIAPRRTTAAASA